MRRMTLLLSFSACLVLWLGSTVQAQDVQTFRRGDVDADGSVDLSDVFKFLNVTFLGAPAAVDCDKAYDFDGDGDRDTADAIYMLEYQFTGGPNPPGPFGDCGVEAADTGLTCNEFPGCPLDGGGLSEEELEQYAQISHVLRRIAYGQTPTLFEDVLAMENGAIDYIDEQLAPSLIDETLNDDLNDRLDLLNFDGDIADLQRSIFVRGIYAERQLVEVLTDFWDNHFNTFFFDTRNYFNNLDAGGDVYTTGEANALAAFFESQENQGYRDNALGTFEDLLLNSALSVTMTIYLDSIVNVVGAPNENYAREIMELHTMGVDNGYTQADIEELAKVFTGWNVCLVPSTMVTGDPIVDSALACEALSLDPVADGNEWVFTFDDTLHDNSVKTIFPGTSYEITLGDDEFGIDEGLAFITHLSTLTQTAEYVSTKLVQKFVADDAPPGLVASMVATWLLTDGDMTAVVEEMLTSDDFLLENRFSKIQTPMEFILSTVRNFGGDARDVNGLGEPTAIDEDVNEIRSTVSALSHLPFYFNTPDGFPESGADQLGTFKVLQRINYNKYIADETDKLYFDGRPIMESNDVDLNDAAEIAEFWMNRLFGGSFDPIDLELAEDFLNTHENGVEVTLSSGANLYERRIRQFLTFLASYPQALQQ